MAILGGWYKLGLFISYTHTTQEKGLKSNGFLEKWDLLKDVQFELYGHEL